MCLSACRCRRPAPQIVSINTANSAMKKNSPARAPKAKKTSEKEAQNPAIEVSPAAEKVAKTPKAKAHQLP
jgi:hypothetical protein